EAAALALRIGDEELHSRAALRLADLDRPAESDALIDDAEDVELPAGDTAEETSEPATRLPVVEAQLPSHAADRVPPGQHVTSRWPVLHQGPIPKFDPAEWRLTIGGATKGPFGLTYEELKSLGPIEMRSDFHCVTGWSKLDNVWTGVQTKVLLDRAVPKEGASHVLVGASFGYTANVPIEVLYDDEAVLAWAHNGKDLAPKHGFPLRLVVPKLYAWKSVKWVRSFEVLENDRRGFWELRGYHNEADPWREERYSYQER
ncbi:MAG: hypothetical protein QOH26_2162, partial [Actinomycetota bacterium]|nr:hypothetical protein [Actinomycetota bacterium]